MGQRGPEEVAAGDRGGEGREGGNVSRAGGKESPRSEQARNDRIKEVRVKTEGMTWSMRIEDQRLTVGHRPFT
jgi:hypothetical protein